MSHTVTLSDEAYRALTGLASAQGQTPESLIEAWIIETQTEAARDPYTNPRYFSTAEWFRHLGADDEMIREALQRAKADDDSDADA